MEGQPDAPYAAVFPARREAFVRLRTFVDETCARAAVPRPDALRLMLLIEELFVNTVEHGHGGDSDAPVRLALTVLPSAIAVEYEDTARPYDPFGAEPAPADGETIEERPVGGLGVRLIRTMADEVGYVPQPRGNRIRFRLTRSA